MRVIILLAIIVVSAVGVSAQNIERMFQVPARIYLYQSGIESNDPDDLMLRPVERMVPNDFKLQYALQELFEGEITAKEEEAGFSSPTFGMKFEGVSMWKGTAIVRFSQPPNQTNYGSLGPFILAEAITKTAKQFKSVKRVNICAVGETMIDSELDRKFPRCPKGGRK